MYCNLQRHWHDVIGDNLVSHTKANLLKIVNPMLLEIDFLGNGLREVIKRDEN